MFLDPQTDCDFTRILCRISRNEPCHLCYGCAKHHKCKYLLRRPQRRRRGGKRECDPGYRDDGLICTKDLKCTTRDEGYYNYSWGSVGCTNGRSFRIRGYDDCYRTWIPVLKTTCEGPHSYGKYDEEFKGAFLKIGEFFKNLPSLLKDAFSPNGPLAKIFDPKLNGVASAMEKIGSDLADAFDPEKNGVASAFRKFGADIESAFEEVGNTLKKAFDPENIKRAFGPMVDAFNKLGEDIGNFFSNPENILGFITTLMSVGASFLPPPLSNALMMLSAATNMIGKAIMGKPFDPMDAFAMVQALVVPPQAQLAKNIATTAAKASTITGKLAATAGVVQKEAVKAAKTSIQNFSKMSAKDKALLIGKGVAKVTDALSENSANKEQQTPQESAYDDQVDAWAADAWVDDPEEIERGEEMLEQIEKEEYERALEEARTAGTIEGDLISKYQEEINEILNTKIFAPQDLLQKMTEKPRSYTKAEKDATFYEVNKAIVDEARRNQVKEQAEAKAKTDAEYKMLLDREKGQLGITFEEAKQDTENISEEIQDYLNGVGSDEKYPFLDFMKELGPENQYEDLKNPAPTFDESERQSSAWFEPYENFKLLWERMKADYKGWVETKHEDMAREERKRIAGEAEAERRKTLVQPKPEDILLYYQTIHEELNPESEPLGEREAMTQFEQDWKSDPDWILTAINELKGSYKEQRDLKEEFKQSVPVELWNQDRNNLGRNALYQEYRKNPEEFLKNLPKYLWENRVQYIPPDEKRVVASADDAEDFFGVDSPGELRGGEEADPWAADPFVEGPAYDFTDRINEALGTETKKSFCKKTYDVDLRSALTDYMGAEPLLKRTHRPKIDALMEWTDSNCPAEDEEVQSAKEAWLAFVRETSPELLDEGVDESPPEAPPPLDAQKLEEFKTNNPDVFDTFYKELLDKSYEAKTHESLYERDAETGKMVRKPSPVDVSGAIVGQGKSEATLVAPNLWLGNKDTALDSKWLKEHGIKEVFNCTPDVPFASGSFKKHRLEVLDRPEDVDKMTELGPAFAKKIVLAMDKHPVLVHCIEGRQRSPTLVALVMASLNPTKASAMKKKLQRKRPIVFTPNATFDRSLKTWLG
jgi:hypothetical protein